MNRQFYFLTVFAFVALLGFMGCNPSLEVDKQILQRKIYDPTVAEQQGLEQSTVLYFDQSTCMMPQYRDSSKVFVALRPQLGQYCDIMQLMQGGVLETIPLDREDNKVAAALQRINIDIPFTDIRSVIFKICNSDQQAILITDCESWSSDKMNLDLEAYMSEPFRNWLRRGNAIYIAVEPYQERWQGKIFDKQRFYFFFTNDSMAAPIIHLLGEIEPFLRDGSCQLYKMTNSDLSVKREGEMMDENLDFELTYMKGFDYIEIYTKWGDIRKYIMMLNKYGEPTGDEPVPLIKNLFFNDGNNYIIKNVEIEATDITAKYLSIDCNAASYIKLDCDSIQPDSVNISEGFSVDKNALQNRELKVFLTDRIVNYLTDEYSGHLIRLDFVITEVEIQPVPTELFKWQSLFNNGEAICVSQSIVNALHDVEVVPHRAKERRIIHTVFLKTEKYK